MPVEHTHTYECSRCGEKATYVGGPRQKATPGGDSREEWLTAYEGFRRHGLHYTIEVVLCPSCTGAFVEWANLTPVLSEQAEDFW